MTPPLAILLKAPRLGMVKARLAAEVGDRHPGAPAGSWQKRASGSLASARLWHELPVRRDVDTAEDARNIFSPTWSVQHGLESSRAR